jgi:hypothetical protein
MERGELVGLAWKDVIVPKPFPKGFCDDVIRVAGNRDPNEAPRPLP